MGFEVELTGRSDYSDNIKMAVVGHAGAGKTLFSSTAPMPLFLFFREQPRIMSIANRHVPHVKVIPQYDEAGRMTKPVEDIMLEVRDYLLGDGSELYETVVIDTGDELQKALKEGKKFRNRGKWGISDWGWLADEYTAIVNAFIDLPMHVIITYHLKNTQEGEDGSIFKEIALQGSAKDDAPGWFDIVGVLDSYEQIDDKGVRTTVRGFATQPGNRYSWIKDHSGQLPPVFDLSENFVGDFDRIQDLIYGQQSAATMKSDHEVIEVVTPEPKPNTVEEHPGVPTPEEVQQKKAEKSEPAKTEEPSEAEAVELLKSELGAVEVTDEEPEQSESPTPVPEAVETEPEEEPVQQSLDSPEPEPEVGALDYAKCEVCGNLVMTQKYDETGEPVTDSDGNPVMVVDDTLIDLGKVKYRKVLCKEHLLEKRRNG